MLSKPRSGTMLEYLDPCVVKALVWDPVRLPRSLCCQSLDTMFSNAMFTILARTDNGGRPPVALNSAPEGIHTHTHTHTHTHIHNLYNMNTKKRERQKETLSTKQTHFLLQNGS